MAYRDRTTLFGLSGPGLPIAAGDTPGGWPAGTRGIAFGEPAKGERVNRLAAALAENDDYLYNLTSVRMLASTEVAAVLAFTGSQINIDPTGAAGGHINFTGYFYMGDALWANNQENRDTLFQLLDENYNEVIVDGVEVKVSGFTGGHAVGEGFINVLMGLTLNKTIPAGNYRVVYGRGRTVESLPPYALIRADVRGLHEAPGEAGRQSVIVVDPNAASSRPADYKGPTALQDALDACGDNKTLFLRAGNYTVHMAGNPAAPLSVTNNWVTIIGEGRGPILGVVLTLPAGLDLNVSGTGVKFENVRVESSDADRRVYWTDDDGGMDRCVLTDLVLELNGVQNATFSNMTLGGDLTALYIRGGTSNCIFDNLECLEGATATQPIIKLGNDVLTGASHCTFRNVTAHVTAARSQMACLIDQLVTDFSFYDCTFTAGTGIGVGVAAGAGPNLIFDNCHFESDTGQAFSSYAGMEGGAFRNCTFTCLTSFTAIAGAPVGGDSFVIINFGYSDVARFGTMENCYFDLHDVAAANDPDVQIAGVTADGLHFDYTDGFDGTQDGIQLKASMVRNLKVNMGGSVANMSNAMAVISLGNSTYCYVEKLEIYNAVYNIGTTSVVSLDGTAGRGRAEVHELYIQTSGVTVFTRPLIRMGDHSVLTKFQWDDQAVGAGVNCLIGYRTDVTDVTIRDCVINTHDNSDHFTAIVLFKPAIGDGMSVNYVWIEDNVFNCRGDAEEAPASIIRIDEGTGGSSANVWIKDNVIDFGLVDGQAIGNDICEGTAIWVGTVNGLYVQGNRLTGIADSATAPGGQKFIYNAVGSGFDGSTGANPTLVRENILYSRSTTAPAIGNAAASNNSAFWKVVENNLFGNAVA